MENNDNKASNTALVVRYRHWFRSFLDTTSLPQFAADNIDSVPLHPVNVFRTRFLVGRGPFQHNLFAIPQLWFNQGESSYPTFTAPNVSPAGAGLFATHKPRKIEVGDTEAICVGETSIVHPVPDDFMALHESARQQPSLDPNTGVVHRLLLESQKWVEQAVGLYALCQYPLVWEPLAVEPMTSVVDLAQRTLRDITSFSLDCQIPFRLDVSPKLQGNNLVDGALTNLSKLENTELHLPLLLLQRTLWQKNAQLRFLEAFWLLDYMTSQHKAVDVERKDRERMYSLMSDYFAKEHPEFNARVQSLKHVVLQAPQRSRMQAYFEHLGITWNGDLMRRMTALRNSLAHARGADPTELALIEGDTVFLARKVMRLELQTRGFCFDGQQKE